MAIQLYRIGTSHNVKGIECEVKNFSIRELDEKLAQGWVKSPSDINAPLADEPEMASIETMEVVSDDKESLHPTRVAAKAAGIEGWEKKRIGTLETELEI